MLFNGKIKVLSYNVAGLRSKLNKNIIMPLINTVRPDIVFLQEIKIKSSDIVTKFINNMVELGYTWYDFNIGQFGTCFFSKYKPLTWYMSEGRLIKLKFVDCTFVNVYAQNAGQNLKFMNKKIEWNKMLMNKLGPNCILCGDLNVVHELKDIWIKGLNIDKYKAYAGFTDQERDDFKELVKEHNLVDVFRTHSNKHEYTYYNYRSGANKNFFENKTNRGWRLDYYFTNMDTTNMRVKHLKYKGSDHLPVLLVVNKKPAFIEELGTVRFDEIKYKVNNTTYVTRQYRQTGKSEHKPLYKCLAFGHFNRHQFFVANQTYEKGYQFLSFPDYKHYECYVKEGHNMYEIIRDGSRCKLYFDIDNNNIDNMKNIYFKVLNHFNLQTTDIFIKRSMNGFHLICNKYFEDINTMKVVATKFGENLDIDKKVYTKNRLIRMLYGTKKGKDDMFYPVDINNKVVHANLSDYLITVF